MHTRRLSEERFRATFALPMQDVTTTATDVLDIWPYVGQVPLADLTGHEVYDHFVEAVYRSADGRFDHVLVLTRTNNVYLSVVVDLKADAIHGHYLLDLNREYGLTSAAREPGPAGG